MELTPEDLERIRRSIAMSPSVPADQVWPLIDAIEALWDEREELRREVATRRGR